MKREIKISESFLKKKTPHLPNSNKSLFLVITYNDLKSLLTIELLRYNQIIKKKNLHKQDLRLQKYIE